MTSKQEFYERLCADFNTEAANACLDASIVLGPYAKAKWNSGWVVTSIPSPTQVNVTTLVQVVHIISGGSGEVIFRMAPGAYAELQVSVPVTVSVPSAPAKPHTEPVLMPQPNTPTKRSHNTSQTFLVVLGMALVALFVALAVHDGNPQVWFDEMLTMIKGRMQPKDEYQF